MSCDGLTCEGILAVLIEIYFSSFNIFSEQLSSTVSKQLMQRHNQGKRFILVLNHKVFIFFWQKFNVGCCWAGVHIS